jgi:hypothetical protein
VDEGSVGCWCRVGARIVLLAIAVGIPIALTIGLVGGSDGTGGARLAVAGAGAVTLVGAWYSLRRFARPPIWAMVLARCTGDDVLRSSWPSPRLGRLARWLSTRPDRGLTRRP